MGGADEALAGLQARHALPAAGGLAKAIEVLHAGSPPPDGGPYMEDLSRAVERAVAMDAGGGPLDPRRARDAAEGFVRRHTRTPGFAIGVEAWPMHRVGVAVLLSWRRL